MTKRKLTTIAALLVGAVSISTLADARQHRSHHARNAFMYEHPCPSTGRHSGACPGWVIDHIKPLACGGGDHPANMQWQTVEDGKAKDRWERRGCWRTY